VGLRQGPRADHLHPLGPRHCPVVDDCAERPFPFVAAPEQPLPIPEQLGDLIALGDRRDPSVAQALGLPRDGQGDQVVIAMSDQVGPRGQGGHLAVPGVDQAGLAEHPANPIDHRQVERIIGGVAGIDLGGEQLPTRLGGGRHELQLGEVGPMVFTVAVLHQAAVLGGVEPIARGTVQADALEGEFIHVARRSPEVGLQSIPGVGGAEPSQDDPQAVVGEVGVGEGLLQQGAKRPGVPRDPVPDGGLAVIALGEDEGDPDGR
jgi:hypothetical protein